MANLKAVKRKMSKWGVLGNAFLSVVLAVSLMPSYAAFGDDGQEESPKATQEQDQQAVEEQAADGENALEEAASPRVQMGNVDVDDEGSSADEIVETEGA